MLSGTILSSMALVVLRIVMKTSMQCIVLRYYAVTKTSM